MSSIATFYLLPDTKRAEFTDAHRNQKTVTYKRGLFGTKEIVTGDRFLWEYLDSATTDRTDFPYSGFEFIDYFFKFLTASLPKHLESALRSAAIDDHYFAFSADLAASFSEYLNSHPPDLGALSAFAAAHNPDGSKEYVAALREAHEFVLPWFRSISPGRFGVLHITF